MWLVLVATAAEVAALRSSVDDLSTLAISDLNALLRQIGTADPVATRDALLEAYPQLVDRYAAVAGEVTATWYEQVRPNSGYAVAQGSVDAAQTNQLIRYGVRPLFGVGEATVLSLLGGSLQRLIAGASRDTVSGNVDRERSTGTKVTWARVPQAGCCAFCALLASRGAVYGSEKAATGVVGRGMERQLRTDSLGRTSYRGGGVKARGAAAIGTQYHDFCRCAAAPVGESEELPYDRQKFLDLYHSVEYDGYKGTIHEMRVAHGLK